MLWVPPEPDSSRGHDLVTGSDGGEARLFTMTMTTSTVSQARLFCILVISFTSVRRHGDFHLTDGESEAQNSYLTHRVTVWKQQRQIWAV